MSDSDHYLFIEVIAGGKWIDLVKDIIDYLIDDDMQHIKWYKDSKHFIFNIENEVLLSTITVFVTDLYYYRYVNYFFSDDSELPQGEWHDLSTTYRQLEEYRE